jgi:hypothetical protein
MIMFDCYINAHADTTQAKRFARAMKASLIFSSTSHSINVQKVRKQMYGLKSQADPHRSSRLCCRKRST